MTQPAKRKARAPLDVHEELLRIRVALHDVRNTMYFNPQSYACNRLRSAIRKLNTVIREVPR
jgi:hypothetical protein